MCLGSGKRPVPSSMLRASVDCGCFRAIVDLIPTTEMGSVADWHLRGLKETGAIGVVKRLSAFFALWR